MATAADDLAAVQASGAAVTTAQAALSAAQAAVATAQANLDAATATGREANAQFAADLASAPGVVVNGDGSVTVYSASATDPRGWTSQADAPLSAITSAAPPAG